MIIEWEKIHIDVYKNKENYWWSRDSYYIVLSSEDEWCIAPQVKNKVNYDGKEQELYSFDYESDGVGFIIHGRWLLDNFIDPFRTRWYFFEYIN